MAKAAVQTTEVKVQALTAHLIILNKGKWSVSSHTSEESATRAAESADRDDGWIVSTPEELGSMLELDQLLELYNAFKAGKPIDAFKSKKDAVKRVWNEILDREGRDQVEAKPEPAPAPEPEAEQPEEAAEVEAQPEAEQPKAEEEEVEQEVKPEKPAKKTKTAPKAKKQPPAPKKKPAAKAKKEKKPANGRSNTKFAREGKIEVLVDENPKRKGTKAHAAFAKYKTGMTVQQALEAGVPSSDLVYDTSRKFISIS